MIVERRGKKERKGCHNTPPVHFKPLPSGSTPHNDDAASSMLAAPVSSRLHLSGTSGQLCGCRRQKQRGAAEG
jgi:hypothetical protein